MDQIREKLAQGLTVFGTWVGSDSTLVAELVGRAGYDFVIIDTQHSAVTAADLMALIQVLDRHGPTLVRVNWNEPALIMRALDLGAAGIVAPVVSIPEEARSAVAAGRYPPDGIRSFGPVRSYYTADGQPGRPLCFVMVETAEAMDNLDAIAATPGLDGIFVGPHDLALSLGLGLAHSLTPELTEAMDKVVAACRKHDIIPGCAALSLDSARELKERGFRFLAVGADLAFVMQGAAANLATIRSWPNNA
ncbi:MAG: aldolase [Sphingomonadales bacterium]|nr:MAG: aldolase [Sphingomonadales bacterium]